jgi:general secretion pathway protein K
MIASPVKQRGVALIIALLVVFLATTFASFLLADKHLFMRRSVNIILGDQAQLLAISGENWAKTILQKDQIDSEIDHLDEDWAQTLPPLPIEGGFIQGAIKDAQGFLNVNNLVDEAGKADPFWQGVFQRLLKSLELREELVFTLIDWLDTDNDPQVFGGAEDSAYLGADPPYRTANRRISDISELRLLYGIKPEEFTALAPYITALPAATKININTADPLILRAYFAQDPGDGAMANALDNRQEEPFSTIDSFINRFSLTEEEQKNREQLLAGLSVKSDYFWLTVEVALDNARFPLKSLVQRPQDKSMPLTLFRYQPLAAF